jgi:hypothetical protein
MTERFVRPLPFFAAVKEVIVCYRHIFKPIFLLVVFAALAQAFVSLLMPRDPTVGLAVGVLGAVVALFFYPWILYHADSVLMNRNETYTASLHVAKKRFLHLLGVFALYMLLAFVLFLFVYGMQMLGQISSVYAFQLLLNLITLLLLLYIFNLLAFTMPAVILDRIPIFKSFEYSTRLVWGHWWRTFSVIFIYIVPVILLSFAVFLLPTRNISVITLYEFIYHIITYPMMVSLILVLYHDLKTRHQIQAFKHVAAYTPQK